MNVTVVLAEEQNYADNHLQQLARHVHHALHLIVVVPVLGIYCCTHVNISRLTLACISLSLSFSIIYLRDPSPCRPNPPPIECSPRPQSIRRQSSTTEEILIARGFRRQSTTEEMIRCRNFRRQSSQSDDTCQRYYKLAISHKDDVIYNYNNALHCALCLLTFILW